MSASPHTRRARAQRNRTVVLGAVLAAASLTAPGVARAEVPAPAKTVTAIASAQVQVVAPAKLSTPTIAAAVEAAREKAGPAAIANVKDEAQRLAKAAGLTLGALQSVAELAPSPFGPYATYGVDGTFGAGKYCGTIRTAIFKIVKGRRVFQHRFRTHFGCRVPRNVTVTVSGAFAAT